nr:hypothetical protein [Streptomyces sp. 846.5]
MLRECPEVGQGSCRILDADVPACVVVHRADSPAGALLFVHNLADHEVTLDLGPLISTGTDFGEVFGDRRYQEPEPDLNALELGGFRWIRLGRAAA